MPLNTALIATYLSLVAQQPPEPTPEDFQRLNALMLQIAMEVPVDVWRAIRSGIEAGNVAGLFDAVSAVRAAAGLDGPIAGADMRWHHRMGPSPNRVF